MEGVFKAIIICSFVIGSIVAITLIWLALTGNVKYEMRTYTAVNENTVLDIKIQAGALRTEYYGGDKISVEYPFAKGYTAKIDEQNGTFRFENDIRQFLFLLGTSKVPDIVLRLPYGSSYDLRLDMSAGAVNLAEGTFGIADLSMSAGSLKCAGMNCSSLRLNISAGSASLGSVGCNSLDMHMSAGSAKIETLACPNTKLRVSAGSARLGFKGLREEYGISRNVSVGSCNVSAQRGTTDKTIDINVSAGSVRCEFGI